MIINHRYKFIFLKTTKTAGTSIEIALSKYCTPDDVVTPIFHEDEQTRSEMKLQGPTNFQVPVDRYSRLDWCKFIATRRRIRFLNHAPAAFVRQYIDPQVWNTYYKFSIERDPWDKLLSYYYWEHRDNATPSLSLDEYVRLGKGNHMKGWDTYAIDGEIVADHIIRFENLGAELEALTARLGLPEPLQLVRAKGNFRKDRRHYSEVMSPAVRDKVAVVYAREIAHFGYKFEKASAAA